MKARIALVAAALLVIGAGCTTTPTNSSCTHETQWDTCVTDAQSDPGLLGTWTLVNQQIVTPTGTVDNPFNGRTLTFTENGAFNAYVEDWSGEEVSNTLMAGTPSVVHTTECTVQGTKDGSWAAIPETPGDVNSNMELWIVTTADGGPEVTCQNETFAGTGIEVNSNAASTPLGVGEALTGPDGDPYVRYTYAIGSGGLLQILQEIPGGNGTNVFVFQR